MNNTKDTSLICAELTDTADAVRENFIEVASFLNSYGNVIGEAIIKLVHEFEGRYYVRGLEEFTKSLDSMILNQEILKLKQTEVMTRLHRLIHELELSIK